MNGSVQSDSTPWRKSSYSSGGQCVELSQLSNGRIAIRNSNSPTAGITTFTRGEIDAFLKGAKAGEFDDMA